MEQKPEGAQEFEGQEDIARADREAMEKILDRAAGDPEFKQRFLDDPDSAMAELGIEGGEDPEEAMMGSEVSGQSANYSKWYWHRHRAWRRAHWHHIWW
jgi:hypothetical protein